MTHELSAAERDVIGHSLGLSRSRTAYRNYFCASPGHDDWDTLMGLVERELMSRRDPQPGIMPDYCFVVTPAGQAAIGHSPPKPIIET